MVEKQIFKSSPVIAAVNKVSVDDAILSPVKCIFLLKGDILSVGEVVKKAKNSGKKIFVHADLLEGLGRDEIAVKFIKNNIAPDGIISTKTNIIKAAKNLGLSTVYRTFLIDNMSYVTALTNVQSLKPDFLEILPGIMPSIIKKFTDKIDIPVICGGLISESSEVDSILKSGAIAASTSKKELWEYKV